MGLYSLPLDKCSFVFIYLFYHFGQVAHEKLPFQIVKKQLSFFIKYRAPQFFEYLVLESIPYQYEILYSNNKINNNKPTPCDNICNTIKYPHLPIPVPWKELDRWPKMSNPV